MDGDRRQAEESGLQHGEDGGEQEGGDLTASEEGWSVSLGEEDRVRRWKGRKMVRESRPEDGGKVLDHGARRRGWGEQLSMQRQRKKKAAQRKVKRAARPSGKEEGGEPRLQRVTNLPWTAGGRGEGSADGGVEAELSGGAKRGTPVAESTMGRCREALPQRRTERTSKRGGEPSEGQWVGGEAHAGRKGNKTSRRAKGRTEAERLHT